MDDLHIIKSTKKQARCIHPSFKCTLCGVHQDNLLDEQRIKIEYLEELIRKYRILVSCLGYTIEVPSLNKHLHKEILSLYLKYYKQDSKEINDV